MKKLFKGALIAGCIMLTAGFAKAQTKIGYISLNNLIGQTTQIASIQTQISTYSKQYTDILQGMQQEYQTKANDYESKRATMTDALRMKSEGELTDLQKRIQDENTTAQNAVNQKSGELLKPLLDQLKAAIAQVAKEKGYTYVIDTSVAQTDQLFLVAPEGDDLMAAVKTKLGITDKPAAPAGVKK